MIGKPAILALLLVCSTVSAEVYRWVDADGRAHFSDRPVPGSDKLGFGQKAKPEPAAEPDQPEEETEWLGPYSAFEILAPAAGATLSGTDRSIPVSLIIDPSLLEGHSLSLVLDGKVIEVSDGGTQLSLKGATLGSHKIQARIRDADEQIVAQTSPRDFHLRESDQPGQLP